MKKLGVIFVLLLITFISFGIVFAAEIQASSQNLNSENAPMTGQNNKNYQENQGLGQTIRNRVEAGTYTSETGKQYRVSEMARNRTRLKANGIEAVTDFGLNQEKENNKTRLKASLSNGRNVRIKIMPDTASERALERLRLKSCENSNCSVELKEVSQGRNITAAYEVQVQRHSRILGIFKKKMQIKSQVLAESGEVVRVKKPWWAFLALEPEE